jgi:hypothetical protein
MAKVFWSPGVLAQIENPERIISQKRMRWGLEVIQKGATKNRFHLGIPCESRTHYVGGTPVSKFIFRFRLNKNVVVRKLHLGDGNAMIVEKMVNYTDGEIFDRFTPKKKYDWMAFTTEASGIILTISTDFLAGDPTGKIIILGAGVEVDTS